MKTLILCRLPRPGRPGMTPVRSSVLAGMKTTEEYGIEHDIMLSKDKMNSLVGFL